MGDEQNVRRTRRSRAQGRRCCQVPRLLRPSRSQPVRFPDGAVLLQAQGRRPIGRMGRRSYRDLGLKRLTLAVLAGRRYAAEAKTRRRGEMKSLRDPENLINTFFLSNIFLKKKNCFPFKTVECESI